MKVNIKILFFSILFLLGTTFGAAAQPFSSVTDTTSADDGPAGQLTSGELEQETGAGFQTGLTNDELDQETGAGFRRISPLELELADGRGFGSDLSYNDLEKMVGQGFISRLSPDEIDRINARGNLTDQQIEMTVQSLGEITARGVRFVVDKTRFTAEELSEIEGRGTLSEIGRKPYSIQIGLFKDMQKALTLLENIKEKGYDPYIFRTRDDDGTPLFAVRLGDYDTIQRAYAQVTHFRGKEHKEAFVTHINSIKALDRKDVMDDDYDTTSPEDFDGIDFDRTYPEGDLRALHTQIQALEREVDKLRVEAEARRRLQMTETEERKEEEEILSAAGREYTLARARTLSFDYSFGYSYNTYDEADWRADGARIKHTANHSLNNTVSLRYSMMDNLTIGTGIPFVYKYHQLGTDGSKDVSDLGDVNMSASWQPFRAGGRLPPMIVSTGLSLPTGRSPYEINPEVDLATGSGVYATSIGLTGNRKIDPAVLFGGINYAYQFEQSGLNHRLSGGRTLTRVHANDGIVLNMGLGYAMSYKASINTSLNASYSFGTTFEYEDGHTHSSGTALSASLNVGTGWRVTAARTVSVGLGIGLTSNTTDFSFSFRIPFDYRV